MHLIFTHEQADFDAIASLLAASLLNPGAVPVLPRRLNRNVRGFLTLYGGDLPLSELGELDIPSAVKLTLVDTQRSPSIKGVKQHSEVSVIDHHPLEAGRSTFNT